MAIWHSIVMAFCTFSIIPMPRVNATKESSRFMLAMLPLVGVVIGAIVIGWWALCDAAQVGVILQSVGLTLLPLGIAGGIHLDGFADVTDAVSSWATPERRREILKDSHIGAFAAMGVACFLLLVFGLQTELVSRAGIHAAFLLAASFVLSRSLSGLTGMLFPASSHKGMLAAQTDTSSRRGSLALESFFAVVAVAAMLLVNPVAALAMLVAAALAAVVLYKLALGMFGGMSGDLSGFFLCVAELFMLTALVIVSFFAVL